MRTHLARVAGFSAGYFAVVLLDRAVSRLENERVRSLDLGEDLADDLEPADMSEVLDAHGCPACCGVAA